MRAVGTHLWRRSVRRTAQVAALAAGVAAAVLLLPMIVPAKQPGAGSVAQNPPVASVLSAEDTHAQGKDGTNAVPVVAAAERIEFAWGTVSRVTDVAALRIVTNERNSFRARLARGSARFEVDPVAGVRVAVETPDAVIEVVGTVFCVSVEAAGDSRTRVTVERGKVRVLRGGSGEVVFVAAGESFPPSFAAAPGDERPGDNTTQGGDMPPSRAQPEQPPAGTVDMPESTPLREE